MRMRLVVSAAALLALSGCATYDYVGGGSGGYYHGHGGTVSSKGYGSYGVYGGYGPYDDYYYGPGSYSIYRPTVVRPVIVKPVRPNSRPDNRPRPPQHHQGPRPGKPGPGHQPGQRPPQQGHGPRPGGQRPGMGNPGPRPGGNQNGPRPRPPEGSTAPRPPQRPARPPSSQGSSPWRDMDRLERPAPRRTTGPQRERRVEP